MSSSSSSFSDDTHISMNMSDDEHDDLSSPSSMSSSIAALTLDDHTNRKEIGKTASLPDIFPQLPLDGTPEEVAHEDIDTPDKWIKRSDQLLRLTGKHPFNAEVNLRTLFDAGFITPSHLHFVRNHGAVPHVDEEKARDWRVRIFGLVEHEVSFSIEELRKKFRVVTLPVTFGCAGNRRREMSVLRKPLGFSWGAAAVSTSLWTGVYLADVLEYVKPTRGAKHVIFEGSDNLPNGPYGTSQRLSWAASKNYAMIIAWGMNGKPITPDHGYPLRIIVPGQIGGRSVKWLRSIEISEHESHHHLHYFDNRLLPTQISNDTARAEKKSFWHDPRYIINEMVVNSIIVRPDHEEVLEREDVMISSSGESYTLQGFAYTGGGRRIIFVEVSFNDGQDWAMTEINYLEDRYREATYEDEVFGTFDTERDTCFAWCMWKYEVPISTLRSSHSITVRATDESMSLQPRDMYPNAMGMLNNWWHRIAIHASTHGSKTELRFEHPALPGSLHGGWMERLKENGLDPGNPAFTPTPERSEEKIEASNPITLEPDTAIQVMVTTTEAEAEAKTVRKITRKELREHDRKTPWFVVEGEVYDGTAFLNEHPGGDDSILLVAGEDATEDFVNIHSDEAKEKLLEYHVGTLVEDIEEKIMVEEHKESISDVFLDQKIWKPIVLLHLTRVNHDSLLYRFSLTNNEQLLGLPVGQHVYVRLKRKDNGEVVQRAYTPVSLENDRGYIDFLIKLYLPNSQFPAGGKMSIGLNLLEVGDMVEVKGPLGVFTWTGNGVARWKEVQHVPKEIGMICGGSGITPILQVLRSILHDPQDVDTKIWLLYSNKTIMDILCIEELDALAKLHGDNRFHLHHTLGAVPDNWMYSMGRINDTMMQKYLPSPSPHALVLACGPDAMVSEVIKPGLERLGWDVERSLVVF